ncbi:signal peptide protein [Paraburkholderia phenoliruptrix BR3459a]|nr:signal peptide protein [Paraburkholderia phenoliruptrix BR3459a]
MAQTTQPVQPVQAAAGVNTQAQVQAQVPAQAPTQTQTPGAELAPAAQGVQPVTPAPTRLTASGSTDPLVQKREANAKANAEYRASKKASKAELKQHEKAAKSEYKEQVRDAKINMKADKQAANNEMKMNMQGQAGDQAEGGEVKH